MLRPLLALLASPAVPFAFQGEPRPVPSAIVEVTVYGDSASVKRRVELPGGDGLFVLAGLPAELDPDSVRVRTAEGEVVGVEVRDRIQKDVPDARLTELRANLRAALRELAGLEDQIAIQKALDEHVARLLRQEEREHQDEVQGGRVNPEAWEANYRYLADKLGEVKTSLRELAVKREEHAIVLNDLRTELGRCESTAGVARKDVILDVVGAGRSLELDYLVANASWEPYYDLRAKKDLSGVELAYRARIQQRTGEDWKEAEILLSTAQPQRGAQGPEPEPVWLSLFDPRAPKGRGRVAAERAAPASDAPEELRALGYSGGDDAPAAAPARKVSAVESEGLSVRYRLPRKETIESRPEPSTVLVGRADLALTSEHTCVPALDTTVWLRGRAKNTSEWILLPGRAAVYFGADFVGHAELAAVQVGQEFDLHLGADPGLTVKRTQLEDLQEGAGVFSSRATQRSTWRIEIENHGAFTALKDGAVDVRVREVLPRPREDRIQVELGSVKPKLVEDVRAKKEREEAGVLTWVVRSPKGGSTTIEVTTEVSFPEDMKLVRQ